MLEKIISGGQTGADRAALDACLETGFPAGGSCPAGRKAEDGAIHERYPLTEIAGGYRQRTKRNVEDADGTVIFYESQLQGGSAQTALFCIRLGKPCKLIDTRLVPVPRAADAIAEFIEDNQIRVLNVAGPRASSCPAIQGYVQQAVEMVARRFQGTQ